MSIDSLTANFKVTLDFDANDAQAGNAGVRNATSYSKLLQFSRGAGAGAIDELFSQVITLDANSFTGERDKEIGRFSGNQNSCVQCSDFEEPLKHEAFMVLLDAHVTATADAVRKLRRGSEIGKGRPTVN